MEAAITFFSVKVRLSLASPVFTLLSSSDENASLLNEPRLFGSDALNVAVMNPPAKDLLDLKV